MNMKSFLFTFLMIGSVCLSSINESYGKDSIDFYNYDLEDLSYKTEAQITHIESVENHELKLDLLRSWLISGLGYLKRSRLYLGFPKETQTELIKLETIIKSVKLNTNCDKWSDAYTFFDSDTITICRGFWNTNYSPRKQLTTLIHELLHILNYGHNIKHSRKISFYYLLIAPSAKGKKAVQHAAIAVSSDSTGVIPEIIEMIRHRKIRTMNRNPVSAKKKWNNYFEYSSCFGSYSGCQSAIQGMRQL